MRWWLVLALAACRYDVDSIGEPCSHALPCSDDLLCGDDSRCVEVANPCVPVRPMTTPISFTGTTNAQIPHALTPGTTAILVLATQANSDSILRITDGAANTWQRAIVRPPTGSGIAIEIWYALDVMPANPVTLMMATSAPAVGTLMDWTCIEGPEPITDTGTGGGDDVTTAKTGMVITTKRTLVIGAIAYGGDIVTQTPIPLEGFSGPPAFMNTNMLSGSAAAGWVPPGNYELTWTLSAPRNAVGVIAAFDVRATR